VTAFYSSIYSYYDYRQNYYSPTERPNTTPTTLLSPTMTRHFTLSSYECCPTMSNIPCSRRCRMFPHIHNVDCLLTMNDVACPCHRPVSNAFAVERCQLSPHNAKCSLRSNDAECPSAYPLYTVRYSLDDKGRSPHGPVRLAGRP